MTDISHLIALLDHATGADTALDGAVAQAFAMAPAAFSASVPDCRRLVAQALPDWSLHLGYGASGMFPYAALSRDGCHVEAEAPTVPLAILRAAARAVSGR